MKTPVNRLFFIDAMRAWAILMMLQGHFIDGLLDPAFRNPENSAYSFWLYFRGITAPVFFTVSGFIFTYLLLRAPQKGFANARVRKGVKRGLQLIVIGYALRLNIFGILKGQIYNGFFLVDVLHCIGLSLLVIVGYYLLTSKLKSVVFGLLLVGTTVMLFAFEPTYKQWSFQWLPDFMANYVTKANGSVFTIIPWLGYTTFGAAVSLLFYKFKEYRFLYPLAILISSLLGFVLINYSSLIFLELNRYTHLALFKSIYSNNYLFIRLGDVLVVFAVFMFIRKLLTSVTLLKIGANTLAIYVIHFIILYGSFTGMGLYKFFHHQLTPEIAIGGALMFMIACTFLALGYDRHEAEIKKNMDTVGIQLKTYAQIGIKQLWDVLQKLRQLVLRLLATNRN